MDTDKPLTSLEWRAVSSALYSIHDDAIRVEFLRQLDASRIRSRTEKTVGYYADFDVPEDLRIYDLPDEFFKHPLSVDALRPDGENAIVFLVHVKSRILDFMEAASTGDWPANEDQITQFAP